MAAEIGLECHVENLDINLADVMAYPFFEDVYQEASVLFAPNGAIRYQVAGLRIEQALAARLLAPAQIGDLDRFFGRALDDGDELHPLCTHLIAKKRIDGAAVFLVGGVDGADYVEFDSVVAQVPPALHNLVKGTLFSTVEPVRVVELAWSIDTQTNQKVVFFEKSAPVIIEEDAVSLKGVLHDLPRPSVLFNEFDGALEEFELHQGWLAPLPSYGHRGRAVGLQQLADICLERGIGHPVLFVRVQRLLGQEEAIGAIDVASGAARLRQQMEARGGVDRQSIVSHKDILVTFFCCDSNPVRPPVLSRVFYRALSCLRKARFADPLSPRSYAHALTRVTVKKYRCRLVLAFGRTEIAGPWPSVEFLAGQSTIPVGGGTRARVEPRSR